MQYYQLQVNTSDRKWKKTMLFDLELYTEDAQVFSETDDTEEKIFDHRCLFYRVLREGIQPPVQYLGGKSVAFRADIATTLSGNGFKLVPIFCQGNGDPYLYLHIEKNVHGVDWSLSKVNPWPADHVLEEEDDPRGDHFIKPALMAKNIPTDLDIFLLADWPGVNQIVVTERFKKKVYQLDFDHSFLIFEALEVSEST